MFVSASKPTAIASYHAALKSELRLFIAALLGTSALCTVIAIALCWWVPAIDSFWHAWVNSQCIGLLAFFIINGGRVLLWPNQAPSILGMVLLCVIGMPLALWVGANVAGWFTNVPADWLWNSQSSVRNASIVATIVGTFIVMSTMWLRQYTAMLRLRGELQQARADTALRLADEAQLRLLRAQLDPHMLFNTLATLRTLVQIDTARAQAMLDDLVSFLRATLAASRTDTVTLEAEFQLLQHYLRLMAIRLGPRLHYELNLASEAAPLHVPALLVQPLVENAIRHGIEPLPEGGALHVSAHVDSNRCYIHVTDTGVGMHEHSAQAKGFGLEAVEARLRSAFGPQAKLETLSPWPPNARSGTRVTLVIPIG